MVFILQLSFLSLICVNSLGPSDTIWRWRSWSILVQVMACCLTAPSHYLNQCWLIISKVLWHSSEDIIIRWFEDSNQESEIENHIFKITLRSPKSQWIKRNSNWHSPSIPDRTPSWASFSAGFSLLKVQGWQFGGSCDVFVTIYGYICLKTKYQTLVFRKFNMIEGAFQVFT